MKSSNITFPQPEKLSGRKMAVKKTLTGSKVTARADSTGTGLENDHNQIVKHHHSVKKMQTPSVRTFFSFLLDRLTLNLKREKQTQHNLVSGGKAERKRKKPSERGERRV